MRCSPALARSPSTRLRLPRVPIIHHARPQLEEAAEDLAQKAGRQQEAAITARAMQFMQGMDLSGLDLKVGGHERSLWVGLERVSMGLAAHAGPRPEGGCMLGGCLLGGHTPPPLPGRLRLGCARWQSWVNPERGSHPVLSALPRPPRAPPHEQEALESEEALLRQQLDRLKAELEAAGRGLPSPTGLPDVGAPSGSSGGRQRR